MIDGIEINNWDRSMFEQLRAGGVSGVHATVAVWEDARRTLDRLIDWQRLFTAHADLVRPALVDHARRTGTPLALSWAAAGTGGGCATTTSGGIAFDGDTARARRVDLPARTGAAARPVGHRARAGRGRGPGPA